MRRSRSEPIQLLDEVLPWESPATGSFHDVGPSAPVPVPAVAAPPPAADPFAPGAVPPPAPDPFEPDPGLAAPPRRPRSGRAWARIRGRRLHAVVAVAVAAFVGLRVVEATTAPEPETGDRPATVRAAAGGAPAEEPADVAEVTSAPEPSAADAAAARAAQRERRRAAVRRAREAERRAAQRRAERRAAERRRAREAAAAPPAAAAPVPVAPEPAPAPVTPAPAAPAPASPPPSPAQAEFGPG